MSPLSPDPSRRSRLRRGRIVVLAVLLVVAVAGCAGTTVMGEPSATPADMGGIAVRLQQQGVSVSGVVSGDAGCDDPTLQKAAIRFTLSGVDEPTPVAARIFIFNSDASYQRLRPSVDACARSFITDASTYEAIDASPFVIVGQGPWPSAFKDAIRTALETAASSGG